MSEKNDKTYPIGLSEVSYTHYSAERGPNRAEGTIEMRLSVSLDYWISERGFFLTLNSKLEAGEWGNIYVAPIVECVFTEDIPEIIDEQLAVDFANDRGVRHLMPYVYFGVQDLSAKVLGAPVKLPTFLDEVIFNLDGEAITAEEED